MTEEQKTEWAAMEERLMPASGKAETVAGEIIRAVDRKEIRGSDFPAEIWNGWLNDDQYTEFTENLVDEMYAFIKAHPELETTPNTKDSRMDFFDSDLDRDEDDEDEEDEF